MPEVKKPRRKPAPPVTFTGISDPSIRAQALDTFARAFSTYRNMEGWLDNGSWQGSLFDPEDTRVAVVDGRVVSGVVAAPRNVRFGKVFVPAMTIGPVGTHDHFRKHGYSASTMWDTDRYMKNRGALLAYLQGIPDYYYRFGYYPYRGVPFVRFKRDDAKPEAAPGRLRPMTRRDIPTLAAIYRRVNAQRTMSARRDLRLWNWLFDFAGKSWFFCKPQVICDARGRICGYLASEPSNFMRELVVNPDEASFRAALGAILREARRREVKDIELPIPSDDPLAVFIRQHVRAEFVLSTNPTGGQLLVILDFPKLMKRLEPTLADRWKRSLTALGNISFTLASEIGAAGIVIAGRRLRVESPLRGPRVHVPRRWLSGLLTGYYSADQIAPRKGARIPQRLRPVLDILFPTGQAFNCRCDNH